MAYNRASYLGLVGVGELGEGGFEQCLSVGEGAFLLFDTDEELVGRSGDEYFFALDVAHTHEMTALESAQQGVGIFFEMT